MICYQKWKRTQCMCFLSNLLPFCYDNHYGYLDIGYLEISLQNSYKTALSTTNCNQQNIQLIIKYIALSKLAYINVILIVISIQ